MRYLLVLLLLFCQYSFANEGFSGQLSRLAIGSAIEAPVQFKRGSSQLTQQSLALLQQVAHQMVSTQSQARYQIEGHTDMSGTYKANMALSIARAQSVVSYLTQLGVPQNMLYPIGFSYDQLIENLPMNDPKHRRVMFKRVN
jgi:outer membrane protein OmpA-like peptidoglycan-associated protein